MKIIAITQARVGSSRLPAKVLKTINGVSILEMHILRILKSKVIDKVIVATTEEPNVDEICKICDKLGVAYFKGSTNDVLDRYYQTALLEKPEYIVRLTSDCPLIDAELVDEVIKKTISEKADYGSNGFITLFPDGQDTEVFTFKALEKAWKEATLLSDREHVTPYIWRNSSLKGGEMFNSVNYGTNKDYSEVRMTLDEQVDLEVITKMIETLGMDASWIEYAELYLQSNEIRNLNKSITRNEGYKKSLEKDKEKS